MGAKETLSGILTLLSMVWDFIDKRDIDKHVVSGAILIGTTRITEWAMTFALTCNKPGIEVAAIIGAILGPYAALQGAAISFYFNVRK